jgi:predicted transcriptional regulator
MDGRVQGMEQEWVSRATTLFAGDTIVAALRVMQELGVRQLPVVDEEHGELLGEVTEEELNQLWKVSPLASMEEILSGRFDAAPEDEAFERPYVRDVAPLVNVFQGGQGPWLH